MNYKELEKALQEDTKGKVKVVYENDTTEVYYNTSVVIKIYKDNSIIVTTGLCLDTPAVKGLCEYINTPLTNRGLQKKYYVKVPGNFRTYYKNLYYKDGDILDVLCGDYYDEAVDETCEFTEEEIKKYGLENCEKVEIGGQINNE